MKGKAWNLLIIIATASFVFVSEVAAIVIFNDGATHTINYTIDGPVEIWNNFWDEATSISLISGGQVGNIYGYEDSVINIFGGEVVGPYIYANNNSRVNMSGGKARDLDAYNNASIYLSGGEVGWMHGSINSQITISGGIIGGELQSYGDVIMTSGQIISNIEAFDGSDVVMSDGSVGGDLRARENSSVYISGGQISGSLNVFFESIVIIEGLNFNLDGHNVSGEIINPLDEINYGHLVGTYLNGQPIDIQLEMYPDASITLVPEPNIILILGLGVIILKTQKLRKHN